MKRYLIGMSLLLLLAVVLTIVVYILVAYAL